MEINKERKLLVPAAEVRKVNSYIHFCFWDYVVKVFGYDTCLRIVPRRDRFGSQQAFNMAIFVDSDVREELKFWGTVGCCHVLTRKGGSN